MKHRPPDQQLPPVPTAPPRIASAADADGRPVWSVMVPVYNAGCYLEEALRSVLRQDPGTTHMQIAVLDDASTDIDVAAVVRRVAGNRVEYRRHPARIGSVRNFNRCVELARGRYVHLLHADDRVLDGYYRTIEHLFARFPDAGACFCRVQYIDEDGVKRDVERQDAPAEGILPDWLATIAAGPRIQYASLTVKRAVYEDLGGYFGVTYAEDWEMHVRIASRYQVAYTPAVLAEYRKHPGSISRSKLRTAANLDDMGWVVETIQAYLPPERRPDLLARGRAHCASFGLHYARQLWRFERDRAAAEQQIAGALRLHDSAQTRAAARGIREAMASEEGDVSSR